MPVFDFENKRLHSFSQRLKAIFTSERAHYPHQNQQINNENLQYGLAYFIARLITKMTFRALTPERFQEQINSYNETNGSRISLLDFEGRAWVRVINGEVRIPSVISHQLFVLFDSNKATPVNISDEQRQLLECLHQFKSQNKEEHPVINLAELDLLLSFSSPLLTKDFLIERGILEADGEERFVWRTNDYVQHLGNEIASCLWLILVSGKDMPQLSDLKKFLRFLNAFKIWPDNLSRFIPYKQLEDIQDLTFQFLITEPDLDNGLSEIAKVHWDSPSYRHVSITNPVPQFHLHAKESFDLLQQVKYIESLHHGLFDYQQTRSVYRLAMKLLLLKSNFSGDTYSRFRALFNFPEKPYLVLAAFDMLKDHSFALPYLLIDLRTTPVFFLCLPRLKTKPDALKNQVHNQQVEEAQQLKADVWLEAFAYFLEKIRNERSYDEGGLITAQILRDLAKQVFRYSAHNSQVNESRHKSARGTFASAWQLLQKVREDELSVYSDNAFRHSLISRLMPTMVGELLQFIPTPWRNEFIGLHLAEISLAIEVLKANASLFFDGALTVEQRGSIDKEVVNFAYGFIEDYFLKEEMEVIGFLGESETRAVRRGVTEFGIEIIEWGYLFLHFKKSNLANTLNDRFQTSLSFDATPQGRYSDKNREQIEKLRIYLKILLLAHKQLRQQESAPGLTLLPVSDTVRFLEETIARYALVHNKVNLVNNRVDVFDETLYSFDRTMYQQPLLTQLYESINLFEQIDKIQFAQSFFEHNDHFGQLLAALNRLDALALKEVVSIRLSAINVEDFIKDAKTLTELETALIEAANSDAHFEKAGPLLLRIEKHLERIDRNDEGSRQFLFEVQLLLAFKNKDEERLRTLPVPESNYQPHENFGYLSRRRGYFLSLHRLYNEHQYTEAIEMLQNLSSQEPQNIDFAFHLYRARLQKASRA